MEENNNVKKTVKPMVSRDVVDKILSLDDKINHTDSDSMNLLKELLGVNQQASISTVIAALLNTDTRKATEKKISEELDILETLDDPFRTALMISSMTKEARRAHWKLVASCEHDVAAEIAGNDTGAFNSKWNTINKEAPALNQLYSRTQDDYASKLDEAGRIIDITK